MPVPSVQPPSTESETIEIASFKQGIHSDQHGSVAPRYTASATQESQLFGDGLAQVENTYGCTVDKTGALVPLPKAQATGTRDPAFPKAPLMPELPYRYVLDAQVGNVIYDKDNAQAAPPPPVKRQTIHTIWGYYLGTAPNFYPIIAGREYRQWSPTANPYSPWATLHWEQTFFDFMLSGGLVSNLSATDYDLPSGSLAKSRVYLGYTQQGQAINTAANDFSFRPTWSLPVIVAMASLPWVRWGKGNIFNNGFFNTDEARSQLLISTYGFAGDNTTMQWMWSPANGLVGIGNMTMCMSLQSQSGGMLRTAPWNMPFPSSVSGWYYHYSAKGVTPGYAQGPTNPYMLIAHQGRVVYADRRRPGFGEPTYFATTDASAPGKTGDSMVWYSNVGLPCQGYIDPPINPDSGTANAPYPGGTFGWFPMASHKNYNVLQIPEDAMSNIGVVAPVTIDQLFVVKHNGGAWLIAGDLDNPTLTRLPFVESTGGLVCKGANTPLGFVYGTPRGIFAWQGGVQSVKLSSQLDGFFWDHTDGRLTSRGLPCESYSGSRGRMAFWEDMVFVPNNYVYNTEAQSWWRLPVQQLGTLATGAALDPNAPYNCYDTDEDGTLFAWPYRHLAEFTQSRLIWPQNAAQLNVLTTPDVAAFGPLGDFDVRVTIDGTDKGAGSVRTLMAQWEPTGNQRSWAFQLDATGKPQLLISTTGAATTSTLVCDFAVSQASPFHLRVTRQTASGNVTFYTKGYTDPRIDINDDLNGWIPLGTVKVGATGALFNSTAPLTIGNLSATAVSQPYLSDGTMGAIYQAFLASSIGGGTVFLWNLGDTPSNPAATSFNTTLGHVVTITRPASPANERIAIDYRADFTPSNRTPPAWYTFDADLLDSTYSWQSHPLISTVDRTFDAENMELLVTGASASGSKPTVQVTLTGKNPDGSIATPVVTTFNVELNRNVQRLFADIKPNFKAMQIEARIVSTDPNGNAAPKVHNLKITGKRRARNPKRGE